MPPQEKILNYSCACDYFMTNAILITWLIKLVVPSIRCNDNLNLNEMMFDNLKCKTTLFNM